MCTYLRFSLYISEANTIWGNKESWANREDQFGDWKHEELLNPDVGNSSNQVNLNLLKCILKIIGFINFRSYKSPRNNETVIFGYILLEEGADAELFKDEFEYLIFDKLTIIRGKYYNNIWVVSIMNFIGFVKNMKGVEKETVIHISIQFWKEPWPYGMDNEETEIRF